MPDDGANEQHVHDAAPRHSLDVRDEPVLRLCRVLRVVQRGSGRRRDTVVRSGVYFCACVVVASFPPMTTSANMCLCGMEWYGERGTTSQHASRTYIVSPRNKFRVMMMMMSGDCTSSTTTSTT